MVVWACQEPQFGVDGVEVAHARSVDPLPRLRTAVGPYTKGEVWPLAQGRDQCQITGTGH